MNNWHSFRWAIGPVATLNLSSEPGTIVNMNGPTPKYRTRATESLSPLKRGYSDVEPVGLTRSLPLKVLYCESGTGRYVDPVATAPDCVSCWDLSKESLE